MSYVDLDKGGRIPQNVRTNLGPTIGWKITDSPVDIEFIMDGGGGTIALGTKPSLIMADWLIVNNWTILSPTVGSIVIDVWSIPLDTYLAGTLPTPADSICGSALPTLTAGVAAESAVLTGWDTQINQNDVLTFHVNSISSLISATLILRCVRVLGNP